MTSLEPGGLKPGGLEPGGYLRWLTDLTADFESMLRTTDLDVPVPNCGDWSFGDLGAHLGEVHRWAATIVRTGEVCRETFTPDPEALLPDWYLGGSAQLLAVLRSADPAAPCWTYGTEKVAAFWFRRQVQETSIHLHDAQTAARWSSTIDPFLAADGVDEVLTVLLPKIRRWHEPPVLRAPLLLRSGDTGHSWLLHPSAEGESPVAERGGSAEGATTLTASAEDLVLLLWKRRSTVDVTLEVSGDRALAEAFLGAPLTP